MIVKVESLDTAIELYHAGLLCWLDGEPWSRSRNYTVPSEYSKEHCYIHVEE